MTIEYIEAQLAHATGVMKLVCGCGNNAAWLVMLEAHDHIKKHPQYRERVKLLYKRALEAWHRYERRLVHSTGVRLFHIGDMPPEIRKKYGEITNREYYDFWTGLGGKAYQNTHHLITCLQNKYRLSLQGNGVKEPGIVAWAMTALVCLHIAMKMYTTALEECARMYGIPMKVMRTVFGQLDLEPIAKQWRVAMETLDSRAVNLTPSDTEERNIQMGIDQLYGEWMNIRTLYDSTLENTENFDDIFRTKGEHKKVLREIMELRQATEEELQ